MFNKTFQSMNQRTFYTIILILLCLVPNVKAQDKIITDSITLKKIPPKSTMARLINRNWFEVHLRNLWTNRSYTVRYTDTKRIVSQLTDSGTISKSVEYDYYLSNSKDKQFKTEKVGKSFNGSYIVFRDTLDKAEKINYIKINFLRGSIMKQYNANKKNSKEQMFMSGIDINQGRKFLNIETTMKLLCGKEWENIEDDEHTWYFEEDVLTSYTNGFREKFMRNYYLTDKLEQVFTREKTAVTKSGKYITIKGNPMDFDNKGKLVKKKYAQEIAFQYRIIHISENKLIVRSIQPKGSPIKEYEMEFIWGDY